MKKCVEDGSEHAIWCEKIWGQQEMAEQMIPHPYKIVQIYAGAKYEDERKSYYIEQSCILKQEIFIEHKEMERKKDEKRIQSMGGRSATEDTGENGLGQ